MAALPDCAQYVEASGSGLREGGLNAQKMKEPPFAAKPLSCGVGNSPGGNTVSLHAVDEEQGEGLRKVREFIAKLKPKEDDEPPGPLWHEIQLEPTPTLLPDLRRAK